jgi:hypothetical protein
VLASTKAFAFVTSEHGGYVTKSYVSQFYANCELLNGLFWGVTVVTVVTVVAMKTSPTFRVQNTRTFAIDTRKSEHRRDKRHTTTSSDGG